MNIALKLFENWQDYYSDGVYFLEMLALIISGFQPTLW